MDLAEQSDQGILAIANPIMDALMNASTARDYDCHVRDFTDRARAAPPKDRFEVVCAAYQADKGFFTGREFVAVFRRPASIAVVWRQGFSRQAGEFVAELVLVQAGDRYLVDHVMVF